MLTKEQEKFLADFADKGIAELKDIEDRGKKNELDAQNNAAIEAKKAELEAQAQKLIEDGLDEFKATLPTEIIE